MKGIAVTGIGVVSPAGIGREAFARAVAREKPSGPPFRVSELSLDDYLDNSRPFRRVADATKFALAAASLALSDAGLPRGAAASGRAGLIVGVTHGAITYSARFHAGLLREGPQGASPLFFSESVLNAPAGNISISFGIRGPVHTLVGEETVGAQAIALAASLLLSRAVDRCLVAGTEEWNEVVAGAYGRIDRAAASSGGGGNFSPLLGEGAAALLLELESTAADRGAVPRAFLAGWWVGRLRPGTKAPEDVAAAVREASSRPGSSAAGVGHVVLPTGRGRGAAEAGVDSVFGAVFPPPRRIDIAPLVGNPVGAAGLLQTAASAAALAADGARGEGLVLSTGIEGTLSAVLVAGAGKAAG